MKKVTTYKAATIPPPDAPKRGGWPKGVPRKVHKPTLEELQEEARARHSGSERHEIPVPHNVKPEHLPIYRTRNFNPDPPKPRIVRERTLSEWEKTMAKYD